jgi:EmrB/QacA subfamily drug resistance transporter
MDGAGPHGARERTTLLAVVSLSAFLAPFMSSSLNLAIPSIGAELGASALSLNWIATVYLVASAALLLPFGRLADVVGRRKLFLLGSCLQGVFTFACGIASCVPMLMAMRTLQGVAAAMAFATGMAILVEAFPPGQRGRALGISTASVYVGLSLGPPLGGAITAGAGWRAVFFVNAALSLLGAVAMAAGVGRDAGHNGERRFDLGAAGLYTASLAALMTGLGTLSSSPVARWLAAAGFAGAICFVVHQAGARAPLLRLSLFRRAAFTFANLAALANYSATFAVTFLLSLYLQVVRGLPPQTAGLVMLAQPVPMALLSPLAGRLSDRVAPCLVASAGMALTAAALAAFTVLDAATPLAAVIGALAVLGTGFALFSSPNSNAVMAAVDRDDYGVASAILGTARLVGQALSMATVALVFGAVMGRASLDASTAPTLLRTLRLAFVVLAVVCLAGVGASLARGRGTETGAREALTGRGGCRRRK